MSQCEVGSLVVITMPNGAMYPFEVTTFGQTLDKIKRQIIHNYGNVQVRIYPKGSVLIGKKVVLP